MTNQELEPNRLYYILWDDGEGGNVRTQLPRKGEFAEMCMVGLRRYGAEEVRAVPCREGGSAVRTWKVGTPGSGYFEVQRDNAKRRMP